MPEPLPCVGPTLHWAASPEAVTERVAERVTQQLALALQDAPRATFVVSGGRTPVQMWAKLCQAPLPWARIDITLADERWVPPTHPDSNEALVRQHLLHGAAARAQWWPLFNGAPSPAAALAAVEARLASLRWPAAVVVLGMGSDGHTASWFPGQALPEGPARCMAVAAPQLPNVPLPRLSLTPAALLDSPNVLLHFQGADKASAWALAAQAPSTEETDPKKMPGMPSLASWCPVRRAVWGASHGCHVFTDTPLSPPMR